MQRRGLDRPGAPDDGDEGEQAEDPEQRADGERKVEWEAAGDAFNEGQVFDDGSEQADEAEDDECDGEPAWGAGVPIALGHAGALEVFEEFVDGEAQADEGDGGSHPSHEGAIGGEAGSRDRERGALLGELIGCFGHGGLSR